MLAINYQNANRMKKLVLAFSLGCLALVAQAQAPTPGPWAKQPLAGLSAQAAQARKPYLVFVTTGWCGYCKLMKRETLADAEVRDYVEQHFLATEIDAEAGEGLAFAARHKVRSFPVLLCFGPDGELLGKIKGYQEAGYFLLNLQPLHKKFVKRYGPGQP